MAAAASSTGDSSLSRATLGHISSPPVVGAGWALFDRRVAFGDFETSATTAYSKTINHRVVRVSLRLAAPPASSTVQLYTDDQVSVKPLIVSADGGLILIHMVVTVKGEYPCNYPDIFFVYKADGESPWLRALPPLFPGRSWRGQPRDTCIICSGRDKFLVANLFMCDNLSDTALDMNAELCRYSSIGQQWEVKRLAIRHDPEKVLADSWETDTVFSFHGYMGWVDYHRGILFYDASAVDPELRFVRFPGIEIWSNFLNGRGLPAMYRTVCFIRGHVKFVDVDNGRFRSTNSSRPSITTWTLNVMELEWERDQVLRLRHLWSLPKYRNSPLPQCLPGFPIFSMMEANILHFILQPPELAAKAWIITVDMKKKSLMPPTLYENPIEDKECDIDVSNKFYFKPMIWSELYNYPNITAGY